MSHRSAFSSSPSSSAFSVSSVVSALLRSSHFPFSIFYFRRKSNVSPRYTRPARNPFRSPTYAKTGGYTTPKNVGAPTFSIFPLIFCSFSSPTRPDAKWGGTGILACAGLVAIGSGVQPGMAVPHGLALLSRLAKSQRSSADSYDLARLNGIEVRQACRDVGQQVFEAVGVRTKNENGDGSAG
jgi:hypothetical protein